MGIFKFLRGNVIFASQHMYPFQSEKWESHMFPVHDMKNPTVWVSSDEHVMDIYISINLCRTVDMFLCMF